MKKYFFIALLFANYGYSQDFHVTQILQSPSLLNPGAVGVYDGWERVSLNQRNQWLGGAAKFSTSGLCADANFFKNARKPNAHLAVGFQVYNDVGGTAKFGSQTGSLTLNGILPLSGGSQLSLGIQTGVGHKAGDMSKLRFDSQWNGSSYDPTINAGEMSALNSNNYLDASTGVFYQFDGGSSSFARNNDMKFQIGVAAFHVNNPTLKFRTGSNEKLHRKYVFMANYSMDLPSTKWSFDAQGAQFIQGGHFETILGGFIRRRFSEGTKTTGFSRDASVALGAYFRAKDAISPAIQVDYFGFRFGISYDATISSYRNAQGAGSLEFSISYTNVYHALFKNRRNKW